MGWFGLKLQKKKEGFGKKQKKNQNSKERGKSQKGGGSMCAKMRREAEQKTQKKLWIPIRERGKRDWSRKGKKLLEPVQLPGQR